VCDGDAGAAELPRRISKPCLSADVSPFSLTARRPRTYSFTLETLTKGREPK